MSSDRASGAAAEQFARTGRWDREPHELGLPSRLSLRRPRFALRVVVLSDTAALGHGLRSPKPERWQVEAEGWLVTLHEACDSRSGRKLLIIGEEGPARRSEGELAIRRRYAHDERCE